LQRADFHRQTSLHLRTVLRRTHSVQPAFQRSFHVQTADGLGRCFESVGRALRDANASPVSSPKLCFMNVRFAGKASTGPTGRGLQNRKSGWPCMQALAVHFEPLKDRDNCREGVQRLVQNRVRRSSKAPLRSARADGSLLRRLEQSLESAERKPSAASPVSQCRRGTERNRSGRGAS
jgi:hypothetical protein